MSNLDQIVSHIIEDANQEANRLMEEARLRGEEKNRALLAAVEAEAAKFDHRKEAEAARIQDRVRTGAEREARNRILTAKQAVMDRTFALAQDQLRKMSGVEFKKILDRHLAKLPVEADAILEIPQNRNYEAKGWTVRKVSNLSSGFRIIRGGVRENYDFDELVETLRHSLDSEIIHLISER